MIVSPFYAGLLAIWFIVLSVRVMQGRTGTGKPSLGDGGDLGMTRRIRGHANFSEYVPLALILIAFLELNSFPNWMLHSLGLMLLLGRVLHGYALAFTRELVFGRAVGILLTMVVLVIAGISCVCIGLNLL